MCRGCAPRTEDRRAADLTALSGDFNNSVYWDKPGGTVRFGDFMDQLESHGFVSAYHHPAWVLLDDHSVRGASAEHLG